MKVFIQTKMHFAFFGSLVIMLQPNCAQMSETSVMPNELGGTTKRVIYSPKKTAIDSVFNPERQLNRVITYYYTDTLKLKNVSYFKNNVRDSISIDYYENGNIKSKRFYFQGKESFERTDYFQTGELSQYIFLSSDHRNLYVRVYDEAGNCVSTRGSPFFESFIYSNHNHTFAEKDTITALFFAPAPPDCRVKLYTLYDDREIDNIKVLNEREKFIFRVKIYPLEKGQYDWFVKMNLFDLNGKLIFSSDTTSIHYQVR